MKTKKVLVLYYPAGESIVEGAKVRNYDIANTIMSKINEELSKPEVDYTTLTLALHEGITQQWKLDSIEVTIDE